MVMKALRDGAKGGISKFILFGLLVLAAGGLMLTDTGGFFRGGVSASDVARAGDIKIKSVPFQRNVNRTLRRLGIAPQEAYRLGYIDQLLNAELRASLLQQAADDSGIMIGRERIAEQLRAMIEPQVQQGQNPKDVLNQILVGQGMSEKEFVDTIGRTMATGLLASAVQGGFAEVSGEIAGDVYLYQKEKRDIEFLAFKNSEIKDLPEPAEEQLQQFYQALKETFSMPEMRGLKIVKINTEGLKKTLEISEEEIRQNYDENIDYYSVGELHELEQAIVNTEEHAKSIVSQLNNGSGFEKAVKDVTGSTSAYLGAQDFKEDDLLDEIKEPVMAAKKPGAVLAPVNTPLGWYVIVVKEIKPAKVKSFAEVKEEIRDELLDTLLIDQQYALANTVDDLLASGASLEDVGQEVDLEITPLPAVNNVGRDAKGNDALKNYEQSRAAILQTGFQLLEGETSAVLEMPDGSFMAVHAESVTPKSYKSFEDVRGDLRKRWMEDQQRSENRLRAMQEMGKIIAGEQSLQQLAQSQNKALQKRSGFARGDEVKAPLTVRAISSIFESPLNQPILIDIEDGVGIARVTGYSWPKKTDTGSKDYKEISGSLASNSQNEGLMVYLENKREKYGIAVNKNLLDRLYGPESSAY